MANINMPWTVVPYLPSPTSIARAFPSIQKYEQYGQLVLYTVPVFIFLFHLKRLAPGPQPPVAGPVHDQEPAASATTPATATTTTTNATKTSLDNAATVPTPAPSGNHTGTPTANIPNKFPSNTGSAFTSGYKSSSGYGSASGFGFSAGHGFGKNSGNALSKSASSTPKEDFEEITSPGVSAAEAKSRRSGVTLSNVLILSPTDSTNPSNVGGSGVHSPSLSLILKPKMGEVRHLQVEALGGGTWMLKDSEGLVIEFPNRAVELEFILRASDESLRGSLTLTFEEADREHGQREFSFTMDNRSLEFKLSCDIEPIQSHTPPDQENSNQGFNWSRLFGNGRVPNGFNGNGNANYNPSSGGSGDQSIVMQIMKLSQSHIEDFQRSHDLSDLDAGIRAVESAKDACGDDDRLIAMCWKMLSALCNMRYRTSCELEDVQKANMYEEFAESAETAAAIASVAKGENGGCGAGRGC